MNWSFGIFCTLILALVIIRKRFHLTTILTGFDTSKVTKLDATSESHAKMILIGAKNGYSKDVKEVSFPVFQAHTGSKAIWSDCTLHPIKDKFYFYYDENYYIIEKNTLIYIPSNKNIHFVGNVPSLKFYI